MTFLDSARTTASADRIWEHEILPALDEYIRIPNRSPAFDKDWQQAGHMDRAVALIEQVAKVPLLVNFGGDLRTAGSQPSAGAWQVGIESIAETGKAGNLIKLATGALATSGDTRRFIEIDGRRFGHIIDARTGWPAPGSPRSITVAADTCSQAGTFTTLAMLHGKHAEEFLKGEGVRHWCLR